MNIRFSRILMILFFSMLFISVSFAQRQTGSLTGKVVDDQGNPLPGVSVALSGPALLGTEKYITTEGGDFRFPAVPPGQGYVLLVEMPGFNTVKREEIIINVGMTVRLSIEMSPETLKEEVTVIAGAPTVDVTSTKLSVTYSSELIKNIPLARDYMNIINTAPGVIPISGSGFYSSGAMERSNTVSLDGVSITDPIQGLANLEVPFDIFEEIEFELSGHPAEVGMTAGAYVNIVTKSGGNDFHGDASAYYFNKHMTENLLPFEHLQSLGLQAARGTKSLYDFSATLGGPIKKNKLWFFMNGRLAQTVDEVESILDGVYDNPSDDITIFGKLTFQVSPKLKLMAMTSFKNSDIYAVGTNYYYSKVTSMNINNGRDIVSSLIANWILNQNSFFDIRFQYMEKFQPFHPNPGLDPSNPTVRDRFTNIITGSYAYYYDYTIQGFSGILSFNRFLDNFLGADHEIKIGVEFSPNAMLTPFWKQNPFVMWTYKGLPWGYNDIKAYRGYFTARIVGEKSGDWSHNARANRLSAYIQDGLTFKDRVTINLGLRYDEFRSKVDGGTFKPAGRNYPVLMMLAPKVFAEYTLPDANNIVVWKDLSPRIGVVFDVFGDQKTSLRASWSRYHEDLEIGRLNDFSPLRPFDMITSYWDDLDMDGIMETTDSFTPTYIPPDPTIYTPENYLDPNLKSPYSDEIFIGLERVLFKDFRVSLSYTYKTTNRLVESIEKFRGNTADSGWWVPYTANEPGSDGKFGTSDDQQITVYGVKKGAPKSNPWFINYSDAKRKYQGLDLVLQKRMSNGWQFLASVTLSKAEGNTEEVHESEIGRGISFDTPNWFINRYGKLTSERPLVIKLQGTFTLPFNFLISGFYRLYSGSPWARSLQIQLPNDARTFEYPGIFTETILPEPIGTRRNKMTNYLDLRMEKTFSITKSGRLGFFLDIINALGETGYAFNTDPGGRVYVNGTFQKWPTYGQFTGVSALRTYKVSARFSF